MIRVHQLADAMKAHIEVALAAPPWWTLPAWSDHFKVAVPTYIENWPAALCRLSIGQSDIPLSAEEAHALGTNIAELGEGFGPEPLDLTALKLRLSGQLAAFPCGVFVRLGSRSPKDAYYADISIPAVTADDAIRWLTGGSERIYGDLQLAAANDYNSHIFLRQWLTLEPWQEFRCFMKERKLVGISQYYYHEGRFEQTIRFQSSIQWAIEERFFPAFERASHLDDVVFDVFVKVKECGNEIHTEVKLLEINPFTPMTDPCLFDWRDPGMFDGRMIILQ